MKALYALVLGCALMAEAAFGAVGCTLNDPDRDVKRLFPEADGYRTEFISIEAFGEDGVRAELERKLGDTLDPDFETDDVPYAYYTVSRKGQPIGRIHGVNQKGRFGGMQLILATDLEGTIISFYYQKISSPEAGKFRSAEFTGQFAGLSLGDFYEHAAAEDKAGTKLGRITDPTEKSARDFEATLRGVFKNLILLDIFKLERKHDRKPEPAVGGKEAP